MRPDPSHANLKYRPEVDGLRALAVLPVILFHAGFNAFKGGFVGVDVFFVISGYLITSIIANDCRTGAFSLATFYERRARRILPALFVVTAACLPLAWAWMLPVETIAFSRSLLAVITFVPNVYFWLTTSYFGTAAEKLPLLHTWSLGVEEQFYLLFPLLLWFAWRFGIRVVAILTILLACVSFGLSEWGWRAGKFSSSFFLAPTRAWELMLGALLALAWQRRPIYERLGPMPSNVGSLAGLGMLAYAVLWFEKTTPTPSVYALLPTVGTSLIIACAGPATLAYRLLASPPLVSVGLISYSAYLWHQPLFAFARLRTTQEPSWQLFGVLSTVALGLAYLTWRFVETPFRRAIVVSRAALVRSAVACWAVLFCIGLASEWTSGFGTRIRPEDVPLAALADSNAQGRYVTSRFVALDRDFSRQGGATKVLVVGDSYAQDFVNAIFESGNLAGAEVRTFSFLVECQIYVGPRDVSENIELHSRSSCAQARGSPVFRRRAAEADVIILAAAWRQWAAQLLPETLQQLGRGAKRQVFVVGPKLTGEINVRDLLQNPPAARVQERQPVASRIVEMERNLTSLLPVGTYVSMQAAVCGTGPDCNLFTPQGELISFDGTHLTKAGALHAGRNLFATSPLSSLMAPAR
jgi:peptidoglycan/LPS O-acetylase OafA/YrhL